jgi:hypothetical protein
MNEKRVNEMLSDRQAIPWCEPGAGLRERILGAIAAEDVARHGRFQLYGRLRLAAAACLVIGVGAIIAFSLSQRPSTQAAASVQIDPSPLFTPALRRLTESADASMNQEARTLLDDADRMTQRVIAQLPFTGTR